MADENPTPTNGSGGPPSASQTVSSDDALVNRIAAKTAQLVGASVLLDRQAFARTHGKSFHDATEGVYKRDLYEALGYAEQLTVNHYRSRFQRGGVASKIVKLPATATWSGGFDLVEDPDPGEETTFESAVLELYNRLGVVDKILRADILAGLGRYGVIYIGAPGDDETPLERAQAKDIAYLAPYAEDRAEVLEEVEDPKDPRYGLPLFYRLKSGSGLTGKLGQKVNRKSRKVHHTRIIHVADGLLEDEVCGEPRLRASWNLLDDLDKIEGGGAESIWLTQKPKFAMKLPAEAQTTDKTAPDYFDASAAEDEVTEFLHNLRPFLRLHGVELENIESGVPSIAPNVNAVLKLISATTGIPERILTGSERGELASSQDRSNWADRVQERRRFLGEPVVRSLTDRFIGLGALPEPAEPYVIQWPDIDELNEKEKAEVALSLSEANKNQADAEGTVITGANEIRDTVFGRGPLEDVSLEDEPDEDVDDTELAAAAMFTPARLRAAKRKLTKRVRPPRTKLRLAADRIIGRPERAEIRAIHRAADEHAPKVASLILAFWLAMGSQVDAEELESALQNKQQGRAEALIISAIQQVETDWQDRIEAGIKASFDAGALESLKVARSRGSWLRASSTAAWADEPFRAAAFSFEFDEVNPRAVQWAANRSSDLITEVGPETIAGVRRLIAQGFTEGIPPRKLAQQIRQLVGLRADQVDAVSNLEAALRDPVNRGRLITRFPPQPTLRTKPGFQVRIPKNGLSEADLERRLAKYREMQHNLRARTIARRETIFSANSGQRELWFQARDEGQLPADQKRVWITAGDSAVRDEHAALEGEVVGLDESFSGGFEPGEEPNCIIPGQLVSGRFIAGLKTAYAGPAVEILTRRGHRLALTPNHPVLRETGWAPAQRVKKGDKLLSNHRKFEPRPSLTPVLGSKLTVREVFPRTLPTIGGVRRHKAHNDEAPLPIEQVFNALSHKGSPILRMCSALDLHGDAQWSNGEVEIVGTHGVLKRSLDAQLSQGVSERVLAGAGTTKSLVSSAGSGNLGLQRDNSAAASIPRSGELSLDQGGVAFDLPPLQELRLGPAADMDTVKPEPIGQDAATDTSFVRELLHRGAGVVALDEVVKVRNFEFAGHVYDLQSPCGWMLAENIVISNCRCTSGLATPEDLERAAT